jgi:hypothetical protein
MNTKRGAINISIETIIVMVVAVVVLGIILGLVNGWFGKIGKLIDIGPPDIKATSSDPIHFPMQQDILEVARGDGVNMKVSFFNKEDAAIANGEASVTCSKSTAGSDLTVKVSTTPINVDINQETTLALSLEIPKDATRTEYPCEMVLSNTHKPFFIRVS